MLVTTTIDGTKATMVIEGRLTVTTSPELEAEVASLPESVVDVVMDLAGLEYISSAGLRVLVGTQKLASKRGGTLTLVHPVDEVYDIFEMTGLTEIFSFER